MGHWISMNFLEISDKTNNNSILGSISYKDIDENFINKLIKDEKIKTIQISKSLPEKAYQLIDYILDKKPELNFRIYNLFYYNQYDISFLKEMPHLRRLTIDAHLDGWNDVIDFNILTELNLKSLHLNVFDLKDYSFIQNLSKDIEELLVFADGMSSSVKFDCKWLLQYEQLATLWLGKNAKRSIECLAEMKSLKSLSLRGFKLKSFDFLKELKLEKFELLWNSNNGLEPLKELESLK